MAVLVVDASIVLAWGLPDESSAYADAVLMAVEQGIVRVPEIWPDEIANGLAIAYLRKRLTATDEQEFLAELARLTIQVEQRAVLDTIREDRAAATRLGLTAYDAAYVELAAREGLTLATLDERMRTAAEKSGIVIFRP
jgi:predicted nucleic acid-binding protein